jgi:hypothetical protein
MIVTISVPDTVFKLAEDKGQSVEEFVEKLVAHGLSTPSTAARPMVSDAMERIRALHSGLEHKR